MPAAARAYSEDAEIKPTLSADLFAFPRLMEKRTQQINDKIRSAYRGPMPIPERDRKRLVSALTVQANQIDRPIASELLRAYCAAFEGDADRLAEHGDNALSAAAGAGDFASEAHFTLGEAWCVLGGYRQAAHHFASAEGIDRAADRLRGVQQLLLRPETIHFDSPSADSVWRGIDAASLGEFSTALHDLMSDHKVWVREWMLEYMVDEGSEIAITFFVAASNNQITKLNYAVRDMLMRLPAGAEEASDALLIDFLRYLPAKSH